MTESNILTFTLVIASIVGVLNYFQNRGKTRVDVIATQNATIGTMSSRLDAQGARLDMQASTIEGLRADLKTSNENGASWQKLAEERLVKLDGMPLEIERQKVEIESLKSSAKVVEEANLLGARGRNQTALNNAAAVDAALYTPVPAEQHPHAAPVKPTTAEPPASGTITVNIPADTELKTTAETPATVANDPLAGVPK